MKRESDQHAPWVDDELEHELDGALRGDRPSRTDEARDPEPPADDDPDVAGWSPRKEDETE